MGRAPKWAGSMDNIQDAVEILEREGVAFLLIVGRPGEEITWSWSEPLGNKDEKTRNHMISVATDHIERFWKDEG